MLRAVTLSLLATLTLAACGGDDTSDASHGGLGDDRFEQLETAFSQSEAIAKRQARTSAELDRNVAAARKVCSAIATDDPLLAAQRRTCDYGIQLTDGLVEYSVCTTRQGNCAVLKTLPGIIDGAIKAAEDNARALADADLDASCAAILTGLEEADFAGLRALKEGFTLLERAQRTRNEKAAADGVKALNSAKPPTGTAKSLAGFRKGCA